MESIALDLQDWIACDLGLNLAPISHTDTNKIRQPRRVRALLSCAEDNVEQTSTW